MGASWAVGVNMGLVALAILGGPTALASPSVAWGITSLVPRGGAGPAAGAVGLSKPPGWYPEPATALKQGPWHEDVEQEPWGPSACISCPGMEPGGGCVCPAAHYALP